MIPLLAALWRSLLYDPLAVKRWARAGLLGYAAGGIAFGDQIAALAGSPGAVKWVKLAAVAAGVIAGGITAGEKNAVPGVQS